MERLRTLILIKLTEDDNEQRLQASIQRQEHTRILISWLSWANGADNIFGWGGACEWPNEEFSEVLGVFCCVFGCVLTFAVSAPSLIFFKIDVINHSTVVSVMSYWSLL